MRLSEALVSCECQTPAVAGHVRVYVRAVEQSKAHPLSNLRPQEGDLSVIECLLAVQDGMWSLYHPFCVVEVGKSWCGDDRVENMRDTDPGNNPT